MVFDVDVVARWRRVDDGGTCHADLHRLNAPILSTLTLPAKPLQRLITAVHYRYRCGAYSPVSTGAWLFRQPRRGSRRVQGRSYRCINQCSGTANFLARSVMGETRVSGGSWRGRKPRRHALGRPRRHARPGPTTVSDTNLVSAAWSPVRQGRDAGWRKPPRLSWHLNAHVCGISPLGRSKKPNRGGCPVYAQRRSSLRSWAGEVTIIRAISTA